MTASPATADASTDQAARRGFDRAPVPDRPDTPTSDPDQRAERVGLIVGIAAVVAIAVTTIGRSLWLDEAYTLAAVTDLRRSLEGTNGTMGLYYVLLWPWAQVSKTGWWLRVPSVACALATLLVVRSVARSVGGRWLAALAVPFLAVVPVFAHKSTEARSYVLITLLISLAWWIIVTDVRAGDATARRATARTVAMVGLGVAGSLAHGLFVVHLAPLALVAAAGPRPARGLGRIGPAVAASAAVAWVLRANGANNVGVGFAGGSVDWFRVIVDSYLPGPPLVRLLLLGTGTVGAAVCVRRAFRATDAGRRAAWLVPVVWSAGPVICLAVVSTRFPLNHPRYLTPITPGLALTLAVAVRAVAGRLGASRACERTVVTTGLALGVAALLTVALITTPDPDLQDWKAAARTVSGQTRDGDAVLFANVAVGEPEQHRPPFEAAWAEIDHGPAPVVISSPRPLGAVLRYEDGLRTPSEMAEAARAHDRVWVVSGGTGGATDLDVIMADPGFADLHLERRWERSDRITLDLYTWRSS